MEYEDMTPITAQSVHELIRSGGFKLNPYAQAYTDALQQSEDEYGDEGVRCQCLYIASNIRPRGDIQKAVKYKLLALGSRKR